MILTDGIHSQPRYNPTTIAVVLIQNNETIFSYEESIDNWLPSSKVDPLKENFFAYPLRHFVKHLASGSEEK